jgi:hypothetical protein
MDNIKFTIVFGAVEIKTIKKFENGRMVTYGYGIHRNFDGVETHRTEPKPISSIGFGNGTPFTENDYNSLMLAKI